MARQKHLSNLSRVCFFKFSSLNYFSRNRGKPHYTFYDGPPFATGLPHYGHILAGLIDLKFAQKSSQFIGTIKDIVTRWAHQSGFYVERRFGWDTHGLPVEYEVDKILGVKGPSDVLDMGIGVYNAKCLFILNFVF